MLYSGHDLVCVYKGVTLGLCWILQCSFYIADFLRCYTKKGVFPYWALILTNTLLKGCFSLFFALILTKALPKNGVFSIFVLILTKSKLYQKWCFSLSFPYSYQSYSKKCILLYFALILYQSTTKKGIFLYFAPILTKALPKRVFFFIFCPKFYQKWCFSLFLL